MSKGSDSWVVFVASGLHQGAHIDLPGQLLQVIGSADDCDICLADPGLEARHCAISLSDLAVSVRNLEGYVAVDGKAANGPLRLSEGSRPCIELGDSGVTLKIIPFAELAADRAALETCADTPSIVSSTRWRVPSLVAGSLALIAFAAFATVRHEDIPSPAGIDPLEQTRSIVGALDIEASIDVSRHGDRLLLSGIVEPDDVSTLNDAVEATDIPITFRLLTPEQLLEQVAGVFRTNGYTAELSYRGDGAVFVRNLDPADPAITRVASFVRTDVPLLKNLGFAPISASDDNGTTIYLASPGKRMTTVVDGDIAYIATEDGARYFEGSLLPDGQRVHRIFESGVEVETGTGISLLNF